MNLVLLKAWARERPGFFVQSGNHEDAKDAEEHEAGENGGGAE